MKARWREIDRAAEVLEAARGWREAGLVDEETLAAIGAGGPPAGPRFSRIWRALVFCCVVAGVVTATFAAFLQLGLREAGESGAALLVLGAVLAAATETLVGRLAFRATGAEAATSLLAACYLCAAVYLLADEALGLGELNARRIVFPWAAAVFGLAAWRWGSRWYAGAAAACVLLLAAQFPGARLLWIAAGALLAVWATALGDRDLGPAHRRGVELARIAALAGIYVAVNHFSVANNWIEEIGRAAGEPRHRPGAMALALASLATVLYPPGLLAAGVRSRDRQLLDLGLVTAACSLATAAHHAKLEPLWAVLAVAGAALAGASLLIERWLRAGPGGERRGFTASAIDGAASHERLLEAAAAVAAGQAAQPSAGPESGFRGRGGTFGGGGASGAF